VSDGDDDDDDDDDESTRSWHRSFAINYEQTVNHRYNGPGYNGHTMAVCNCKFLEMLRYYEGFVGRKPYKIKTNHNLIIFMNSYCVFLCLLHMQ
jgi:hypothetical protein